MAPDLVFNSLSYMPLSKDPGAARQRMSQLIQTMVSASSVGFARVLKTNDWFEGLLLADGYTISEWRYTDPDVRREERQLLRSFTTKSPILKGKPDLQELLEGSDFTFRDVSAPDLGAAYLLEDLAVSLYSDDAWDASGLELMRSWITGRDELISTSITVHHAALPRHVSEHKEWLEQLRRPPVTNGETLWQSRAVLFPSLDFSDDSAEHILPLEAGDTLRQLIRRLREMQAFCVQWKEKKGPFLWWQIPGSPTPDSEPTRNKYGKQREMVCTDGKLREFSLHVKMTPNEWRIYFDAGTELGRMFIGPVGPHLKTVNFDS